VPNFRHPASGVRYLGSKGKCPEIVRYVNELLKPGDVYWEPFVGAGKVIQHVRADVKRVGTDIDPAVIALLRAVRDGWDPPKRVTEEEYKQWKKVWRSGKDPDNPMIGFVGYATSFGGRFFEGYARSRTKDVNFAESARTSLLRQAPRLKGISLSVADYREPFKLSRSKGHVIYCDPPYEGTKPCGSVKSKFDSDTFWSWAMAMMNQGWIVLVSEYTCPIMNTTVLWEKSVAAGIRFDTKGDGGARGSGRMKHEKLFSLGTAGRSVGLGLI
jgi:DNA adenine methylase